MAQSLDWPKVSAARPEPYRCRSPCPPRLNLPPCCPACHRLQASPSSPVSTVANSRPMAACWRCLRSRSGSASPGASPPASTIRARRSGSSTASPTCFGCRMLMIAAGHRGRQRCGQPVARPAVRAGQRAPARRGGTPLAANAVAPREHAAAQRAGPHGAHPGVAPLRKLPPGAATHHARHRLGVPTNTGRGVGRHVRRRPWRAGVAAVQRPLRRICAQSRKGSMMRSRPASCTNWVATWADAGSTRAPCPHVPCATG